MHRQILYLGKVNSRLVGLPDKCVLGLKAAGIQINNNSFWRKLPSTTFGSEVFSSQAQAATRTRILACYVPACNNPGMIIGDRLREMREAKKLSQGDIEKRTGLLRCYISRVENGHTVPAIETLEKLARAFEVPLYQLFHDGEEPPKLPNILTRKAQDDNAWGSAGKSARYLSKLRRLLGKSAEGDRKLILYMAQKMANR